MITSGKRSNDIKTFAHKISILKVKLSAPGWRMQFSRKESGPVWTRAQIFSSQFPPGHLWVTQWNIMMAVTILMRLVTTMAMRVLHHLLSDRLPDRDREEWRLLVLETGKVSRIISDALLTLTRCLYPSMLFLRLPLSVFRQDLTMHFYIFQLATLATNK